MNSRYAVVLAVAISMPGLRAQTVLTTAEYDVLKAQGQLPEHPVLVADQQAHRLTPQGVHMKGGGGCGCWVEPDGTYTLAMQPNDDGSSDLIELPFTFNLFGDSYTQAYINNNGNISFGNPWFTYTSNSFPDSSFIMVAPFWGDVDTRGDSLGLNGGEVWYKLTATALYVNWVDVGYYAMATDKHNSFQLIITDGTDAAIPGGNNVSFCYKDMQWTTGAASQGVNGFGGVPATVGVNRGDGVDHAQIGRFGIDDDSYGGPYADTSGISWLDSTHFYMNTAGGNLPPIFGSTFNCDTVVVQLSGEGEAHDQANVHVLTVLPGGPGQQVSCISSAPTLPNYVPVSTGLADFQVIPVAINTLDATVGPHFITFTASNDASTPLTSQYVLQVEVLEATHTGVNEVVLGASGLGLSPNPATDNVRVSWPLGADASLIEVIAADGRVVRSLRPTAGGSALVDLQGLEAGAYMIRAGLSTGVVMGRLVKAGE